jgi:hypothetical protein
VTGSGAKIKGVINSLGLTSVDYFVAGHYHADHIGAIDEIIQAGVALNIASYDRGGSFSTLTFDDYVAAVGTKRTTIALNQQIDLGGGAVVTCYAVDGRTNHGTVTPTGENDRSIAVVLRFGSFDYFIASDLTGGGTTGGTTTADVESLVAIDAGDVDVLHVGHHGSRTSTNQTLVDTLRPQQAVISCGDGNSHGHPTQEVLDRLGAAPALDTIWQAEGCAGGTHPKVRVGGDITFLTDGTTYTVNISTTGQTFSYSTDGVSGGGGGSPTPTPHPDADARAAGRRDRRGGVGGVAVEFGGRVDRALQQHGRGRQPRGLEDSGRLRRAGLQPDWFDSRPGLLPDRAGLERDERGGRPRSLRDESRQHGRLAGATGRVGGARRRGELRRRGVVRRHYDGLLHDGAEEPRRRRRRPQ